MSPKWTTLNLYFLLLGILTLSMPIFGENQPVTAQMGTTVGDSLLCVDVESGISEGLRKDRYKDLASCNHHSQWRSGNKHNNLQFSVGLPAVSYNFENRDVTSLTSVSPIFITWSWKRYTLYSRTLTTDKDTDFYTRKVTSSAWHISMASGLGIGWARNENDAKKTEFSLTLMLFGVRIDDFSLGLGIDIRTVNGALTFTRENFNIVAPLTYTFGL